MIVIPAVDAATLPRLVGGSLAERLRVMPAVVLTGARQTGKSTLAQDVAPRSRRYCSLDDLDTIDAARRDPDMLVGGAGSVTLDEVQREPELLRAGKRAIDRTRRPGQFLLTGSANLLLMQRAAESLAGRASYLTLWPMTRREQRGLGRAGMWDELVGARDEEWMDLLAAQPDEPAGRSSSTHTGSKGSDPFVHSSLNDRLLPSGPGCETPLRASRGSIPQLRVPPVAAPAQPSHA